MMCGAMALRIAAHTGHALSSPLMSDGISSPAVRAPDFPDTLDWVHTDRRRLTLADFRGKLLLLDFWTYG